MPIPNPVPPPPPTVPSTPNLPTPTPTPIPIPTPAPAPTPAEPADWRERAIAAERSLRTLEADLAAARAEFAAAARRQELERRAADAVDAEAVALLAERAIAADPGLDAARAVEQVRQRKPQLFTTRRPTPTPTPAPTPAPSLGPARIAAPTSEVDRAAARAREEAGSRRSLLDYLRAKRRA